MQASIVLRRPLTEILAILARLPGVRKLPPLAWYRPVGVRAWVLERPQAHLQTIRSSYRTAFSVPMNGASPDALSDPGSRETNNHPFRDVSQPTVEESFIAEIDDCWIVRTRYDWGGSEFCICTHDGRPLRFHGLASDVGNTAMRRRLARAVNGDYETLDRATWVLGYWYGNYYHWLIEWLPRIVLAIESGISAESILLPPLLSRASSDTIDLLGIAPHWLPDKCDAWRVGRLTLVSESKYHAASLTSVARRLSAGLDMAEESPRKIWISRRDAVHRKLHQEAEIEAWLSERGWDIVSMERLDLEGQIELMGNAEAIAGTHGAGLTNILFTSPGTPVLEIINSETPSPDYYELASCLGRPYWYVPARPVGKGVVHVDLVVSIEEFKEAIIELEQFLEQRISKKASKE